MTAGSRREIERDAPEDVAVGDLDLAEAERVERRTLYVGHGMRRISVFVLIALGLLAPQPSAPAA